MTRGARKGWRQRLCAVCRHRCWYSWTLPEGREFLYVNNSRAAGAVHRLKPGEHACTRCVDETPGAGAELERQQPATEADLVECTHCDEDGRVLTAGGGWVPGRGQPIVAAARGRRICPHCRGSKKVPR